MVNVSKDPSANSMLFAMLFEFLNKETPVGLLILMLHLIDNFIPCPEALFIAIPLLAAGSMVKVLVPFTEKSDATPKPTKIPLIV